VIVDVGAGSVLSTLITVPAKTFPESRIIRRKVCFEFMFLKKTALLRSAGERGLVSAMAGTIIVRKTKSEMKCRLGLTL
jgi:hypothetical protein